MKTINMKKIFLITLGALFIFSKTSFAQDQTTGQKTDPNFHHGIFGVRFMPSVSTIKVQNYKGEVINGDFVVGYGYGALLGFDFNKHVGLQLEVIYNQLSQKYKDDQLDRRVNINYVNIPLLLSLNTNRAKAVNFNIVAGPQMGINVGSNLKTTGTYNGNSNTQAVLAIKKNDFGFAYGAGLDFCLNPRHTVRLDLGFRGVMGLVDVSDQSTTLQTNSYYILRKDHIQTYAGYIGFAFLF
jgi:opacity protein-like surface antigen